MWEMGGGCWVGWMGGGSELGRGLGRMLLLLLLLSSPTKT